MYFQRSYPIHWDRVLGVASAFGIDANDDRYDLTGLQYNLDMPRQAPGCSVVYYPPASTATGRGTWVKTCIPTARAWSDGVITSHSLWKRDEQR